MRRAPYIAGVTVAAAVLGLAALPGTEPLRSLGPANTGHETLACDDCHTAAEGTVRQQIQANARHLLGLRDAGVDFVHRPIANRDCQACHDNQADRHPVHRFEEPRFADARAAIAPTACTSCHREHQGRRVTTEGTYCRHCHGDLVVKKDPATPTHAELVAGARWETCLRCHDFHGNHETAAPHDLAATPDTATIEEYLSGGPSPWGTIRRFPARRTRKDRP